MKERVFAILLLCASAALFVWAYHEHRSVFQVQQFNRETQKMEWGPSADNSGGILIAGIIVGVIALAFLYLAHQRRQIESRKGDFEYLRDRLRLHGVEDSDIDEFKTALETDPEPTQQGMIGERVDVWLKEMLHKSVSGVWQIPVSEADSLLTTTIAEYYGWT